MTCKNWFFSSWKKNANRRQNQCGRRRTFNWTIEGSFNFHGILSLQLNHDTPTRHAWIPWNLSFHYILFHKESLQMMLWHLSARVNSHQRWKQTRFRVCFHLWCELTSTMKVEEWQVSWNSWYRCSQGHALAVSTTTSDAALNRVGYGWDLPIGDSMSRLTVINTVWAPQTVSWAAHIRR